MTAKGISSLSSPVLYFLTPFKVTALPTDASNVLSHLIAFIILLHVIATYSPYLCARVRMHMSVCVWVY